MSETLNEKPASQQNKNDPQNTLKGVQNSAKTNSIVKKAVAMAFGTTSSRILGLFREVLFAALFPRSVTDAWIAAFRLPNLFRRLLGEGSLSVSFIPVFVESMHLEKSGGANSRQFLNGFFTLLICLLTILTTLGILYAEPILKIILSADYVVQYEKFAMTVRMAQIMFGFIFLVSLYAYYMAILNALGVFALPAMAPVFFNIAMIAFTLIPQSLFPHPGDGLAYGVLVGGFLQFAILIPALRKRNYLPKLSFQWNPQIKQVLLNMIPGLFGLGLLQITLIVNMRFASQLGEGPISWINWADRLLELPLSLISVSLGTALLPTLSEFWVRNEKSKWSEVLNQTMKLNIYLCGAAAVGLFVLAEPIVRLLFQHGKFNEVDVHATTGVLKIWALILIPTACVRILAPAYYSIKNTWFPALISALCLVVHVLLAPVFMESYGLTGLNMSSFASQSINLFCLFILLPIFVTKYPWLDLFKNILKFVPAFIGLGLGCSIYFVLVDNLSGVPMLSHLPEWWQLLIGLLLAMASGISLFVLLSGWFGLSEWHAFAERLGGRVRPLGKLLRALRLAK